jgi:hypothetical protein
MPQARDEAGNIWEIDDAGNAVRLLAPAPPSVPTGIGVDPYKAAENQRQESAEGRDQAKESREEAKARREQIEWEAKFNPDGTPKAAALTDGQRTARATADTKLNSAATLARQLSRMREIYRRSFKGQGLQSFKEWLPTEDGQRFTAVAESMRASLKPLIRGQGEGTFTEGDQKLLDSLIPQPGSWDARNEERFNEIESMVRSQIDLHGPNASPTVQKDTATKLRALSPQKTSDAAPQDDLEVAAGDSRTEVVRGPVENKIAAMLKAGRPAAEIRRYVNENAPGMQGLDAALAWRSMNPGYKGEYDVSTQRVVPTTMLNKVMASPLATAAVQAANATTMGTIDEIGGAARSLVTGEPLADTIASANLNKQMQAQANPKSALAGNILGGAAALMGGGAALKGLGIGRTAWAANNPIKAAAIGDTAYGAAYGAGESNDNRLMGAAVGAPAGLAGSFAGSGVANVGGRMMRGVVNPAVDRLRAAGVPMTVGEALGGGWKKAQDAMTSIMGPGDLISRRYAEGREALNRAAFNEAGSVINTPINAVGQPAIAALDAAKSQAYRDALDPVSLNLADQGFADDLARAGEIIAKIPEGSPARQEAFDALGHRIKTNVGPDGQMSGRNFQEAYKGLARAPRERGQAPYAHEYEQTMQAGKEALANVLERQNPGAFAGFKNANQANRYLSILTDAVNSAKNQLDGGEPLFTPAQLGTSATNNTKNFMGKQAAAQGNRPFNQLINDAQEVMSSKVNNSGTVDRAAVLGALGAVGAGGGLGYATEGMGGAAGGALAPLAVLSLLNTKTGQAALTKALLQRAAPFRKAGAKMIEYAPMGGHLGTAYAVPGFVNQ